MNLHAIRAIYRFEMARTFRTLMESIVSPVLSTSLYFVVFGAAIGARMGEVDGVSYGAFIIPGLIMLSLLSESISNASFGIYMPKWAGTIYELLSAPVSAFEIVLGYVGAAATKSVMLGTLILVTARFFVPYEIAHPFWMICFLLLTQSVMNASFGIYFPRFVGTIYEILSAPVSPFEIVLGYVGAAATNSIVLGLIILATSALFVPLHIAHPVWMMAFLVLT
ncbi:MAG TPA: ABC transporter permease, partial [Lysobacter sp.]